MQVLKAVRPITLFVVATLILSAPVAFAEDISGSSHDPSEIIAFQGDVTLSQQEIDAAFSTLPEAGRLAYIRDGARVDRLIRSLLQRKIVARDAQKAGYDQQPLVATRLELEKEKALAEAWLQHMVEEAPPADFEALAYEHYLANPDAYRSEVILDISHILLRTDERSNAQALKLAESVREQLAGDPSRFEELVEEFSDDPAKVNNQGRYREMRRGMMVAPFEKAAYALQEEGEISEPVKTEYGYHIIRLNGRSGGERQDFEDVKAEAVAAAEKRHVEQYRDNYLRKLLAEPVGIPEGAVEIMAKRHFGEDLELAPGQQR